MNAICRTYRQDDLEALQALLVELGYSVQLPDLRGNIRAILDKGGALFVAEKRGSVIGSICVLIDARLAEGVAAEIVSLVVSENERGAGVGKALIRQAEAWARGRVDTLRVRANAIRGPAHAFYKSRGFRVIKTQKVFLKNLRA